MSRSVKIVEIVNGRESLGGGSLSFLEVGLRRTPERVCAWAGSSGQGNFELAANSDYNSRGSADLLPSHKLSRADGGKTDPEREGERNRCDIWEILGNLPAADM